MKLTKEQAEGILADFKLIASHYQLSTRQHKVEILDMNGNVISHSMRPSDFQDSNFIIKAILKVEYRRGWDNGQSVMRKQLRQLIGA